jgi:hypothetical protein
MQFVTATAQNRRDGAMTHETNMPAVALAFLKAQAKRLAVCRDGSGEAVTTAADPARAVSLTRHEARAVLEALRTGTVNRLVARHLTIGRDSLTQLLMDHVSRHHDGSAQVVVGGYGVGKSHLGEQLADALERDGYVVARVELGATHGRAENPLGVVYSIESSLARMVIDGRELCFTSEWPFVRLAMSVPEYCPPAIRGELQRIHADHQGRQRLLERYDWIRQSLGDHLMQDLFWWTHSFLPHGRVPPEMTAANHAVAAINHLAHNLRELGANGLAIIFDEAERSDWAVNSYRLDRAQHLMVGFARAGANLDTKHLKHHLNYSHPPFRPLAPSYMHCIFMFSRSWGNAQLISRIDGVGRVDLPPLSPQDRAFLQSEILRIYTLAYGVRSMPLRATQQKVDARLHDEDVRMFVRTLVAALDYQRLHRGRR